MRPGRWWAWGPRPPLGLGLSNSAGRANPSACTAGPPAKDGCQTLRSSAKKTNKGTFKNPELNSVGFSFSPLLFCSLLRKPSLLRVNDPFPFVAEVQARGNCRLWRFQESFPLSWMWQAPVSAGCSRRWSQSSLLRCCRFPPSLPPGRNLCRLP